MGEWCSSLGQSCHQEGFLGSWAPPRSFEPVCSCLRSNWGRGFCGGLPLTGELTFSHSLRSLLEHHCVHPLHWSLRLAAEADRTVLQRAHSLPAFLSGGKTKANVGHARVARGYRSPRHRTSALGGGEN